MYFVSQFFNSLNSEESAFEEKSSLYILRLTQFSIISAIRELFSTLLQVRTLTRGIRTRICAMWIIIRLRIRRCGGFLTCRVGGKFSATITSSRRTGTWGWGWRSTIGGDVLCSGSSCSWPIRNAPSPIATNFVEWLKVRKIPWFFIFPGSSLICRSRNFYTG